MSYHPQSKQRTQMNAPQSLGINITQVNRAASNTFLVLNIMLCVMTVTCCECLKLVRKDDCWNTVTRKSLTDVKIWKNFNSWHVPECTLPFRHLTLLPRLLWHLCYLCNENFKYVLDATCVKTPSQFTSVWQRKKGKYLSVSWQWKIIDAKVHLLSGSSTPVISNTWQPR